ncbi:hypothetical protein [Streptomyces stelliscabiei]|uniref:hypothetical protein n=1 Tax=Streptomyces stelliscabiei TaxID=146820 RepID=UPI0029A98CC6|nr:hypothetical protein [Streptomyces stelliscabiei]MDX2552097.1 hypothetical protein [Streptomyces stelliscabiei]MDX2609535.1 hypothetical protein [Streptomyces stelliscabiei]MDX2636738.1 hypothetical protein [Streptomyces stelliscabiei]MDX2660170.1 hypothetical protein [Streptomyces stelliscabiei]MDX2710797.1 hypothetical protein [Streptomyces stelliscabiei]
MPRPAFLTVPTDARVCAVREALSPYEWRRLTPEMVSRRALAAIDAPGTAHPLPVIRHDERIGVLVGVLTGCRWRSLTVAAVSRQLVSALDAWLHESQWLEIELRWLSDADS